MAGPEDAVLRPDVSGDAPSSLARKARLAGLAFVTGFSGAMMPGPLLVVLIEQTIVQQTLKPATGLILGHAILELVTIVLLIVGLRRVIARPRVRGAIGLVGGTALAWMGVDMLRHAFQLTLDLQANGTAAYSWGELMFWGAAVCVANPYFTGWWATVGLGQLAHTAPRTRGEYACFYLGHEASDYTWYLIVAVILLTGRRWLTDSIYHWLIAVCGMVLLVLGARFLWVGVRLVRARGAAEQ